MRQDFQYADLELSVSLYQQKDGFVDSLTPNERQVLSQQIYLSITTFLNTRALFAADAVGYAKRMDDARKRDNEYKGEDG